MALLTADEKSFLQDAVTLYLQLVQQKLPPSEFEKFYGVAQQIIQKLEEADSGTGRSGGQAARPRGISDEWFEHCCKGCERLSPAGQCLEKITEKYPGKCDPILMYERGKTIKK